MAANHTSLATFGAFMLIAISSTAMAQDRCVPTGNMPILTVSGAISKPNRGAIIETDDKFLGFADKSFAEARTFTADELVKLGMVEIEAVSPYDKKTHKLAGPLLSAVLEQAGAKPDPTLSIMALDRFEVEMPASEIKRLRPILALCKNGKPLALGDVGPIYVSFQSAEMPTDDEFSLMVWGAAYIEVK